MRTYPAVETEPASLHSHGTGTSRDREPAIGEAVEATGVTASALCGRLQPLLTPGPEGAGGVAGNNAPRPVRSDISNAIEGLADRVLLIEQTLSLALQRLEV